MSSVPIRRTFRIKNTVQIFTVFALLSIFSKTALGFSSPTIMPTGDGTYTGWTPSTGTMHYTLVDESTCNGNTDYVGTTTLNARDSYSLNLNNVPDYATITNIAITPCASKNSGGGSASTMKVFYVLDGVISSDSGSYSLTSTTPSVQAATNFASLNITKLSTTTLQVGAVYTAGNKGLRLSNIATVLTYSVSLPAAPSNVTATNVTSSQNNVEWSDNSNNETSFKVERAMLSSTTGPIGSYILVGSAPANTTLFQDTNGLSANQTYYYRVYSTNLAGNSTTAASPYVITASTVPTTPSIVGSTLVDHDVTITWRDNSTNEDGFKVERSTDNINFTEVGTVALTVRSFTDTSVPDGIYYYRVKAYNSIGSSTPTGALIVVIPNTVPATPTDLSATNFSSSQNNLSWTDNSTNEQGYKIERALLGGSTGPMGSWMIVGSAPANTIVFQDANGLSADKTYYYRVYAYNYLGNSTYSNTTHAITATTVPYVPVNLRTSVVGSTVTLNWYDLATNEENFVVERSTDNINFSEIGSVGIAIRTFDDTNVPAGTYYYRVKAVNAIGSSSYSNTFSATVI